MANVSPETRRSEGNHRSFVFHVEGESPIAFVKLKRMPAREVVVRHDDQPTIGIRIKRISQYGCAKVIIDPPPLAARLPRAHTVRPSAAQLLQHVEFPPAF